MFKKLYRLNWLFLVIYAATTLAAPGSNNAGGLPQCNTDLNICQTTNTQLQNSLTTCQASSSQLQTSLTSCQSTNTQLQTSLNSCQGSLSTCQTTNTQLQQQYQTDQTLIASLQTSLSNCQATNTQLQQQLQAAQAQITALQSSGSGSTTLPATGNMPTGLAEYVEFSLLPTWIASNRYESGKWDLTGNYQNIAAGGNMTWDATLKAWKAPGGSGTWFNCGAADAIDTAWRPNNGPKTACMWKRYYETPSGLMGLDGFQDAPGTNGKYFLFGTHGGYCSPGSYEWLFFSGSKGATAIGCGTTPKQNEWVFYCMASGGNQDTTSLYTAVPGDTYPIQRANIANGWDSGFTTNPTGMRYGCLDTNQHGSRAYYGSIIHFNSKLTSAEVQQVYQATKVFYPGHGGTR